MTENHSPGPDHPATRVSQALQDNPGPALSFVADVWGSLAHRTGEWDSEWSFETAEQLVQLITAYPELPPPPTTDDDVQGMAFWRAAGGELPYTCTECGDGMATGPQACGDCQQELEEGR